MASPEKVRAKFRCTDVEEKEPEDEIGLIAVGATDEDDPETNRFAEATPYGALNLGIGDVDFDDFFEEGKEYYVDITPVD